MVCCGVAASSYVVVGHCCETGDLISPDPDHEDTPRPRLCLTAQYDDLCVIEGCGAYCASMSAKNYNSFPEAPEVLIRSSGQFALIRKKQTLEQVVQNELPLE